MTQRNISDEISMDTDSSGKKPYEAPVLKILETAETAQGGPGASADATSVS